MHGKPIIYIHSIDIATNFPVRLERTNLAMTQLVEILIHWFKNMETFQMPKQAHCAGSIQKYGKIGEQFWWVNLMNV